MKWGQKLYYAAATRDETAVSLLLSMPDAQSFINYQNGEQGATALHAAVIQGHENVTDLLIAARCTVDLRTNDGYTPLHIVQAAPTRCAMLEVLHRYSLLKYSLVLKYLILGAKISDDPQ